MSKVMSNATERTPLPKAKGLGTSANVHEIQAPRSPMSAVSRELLDSFDSARRPYRVESSRVEANITSSPGRAGSTVNLLHLGFY